MAQLDKNNSKIRRWHGVCVCACVNTLLLQCLKSIQIAQHRRKESWLWLITFAVTLLTDILRHPPPPIFLPHPISLPLIFLPLILLTTSFSSPYLSTPHPRPPFKWNIHYLINFVYDHILDRHFLFSSSLSVNYFFLCDLIIFHYSYHTNIAFYLQLYQSILHTIIAFHFPSYQLILPSACINLKETWWQHYTTLYEWRWYGATNLGHAVPRCLDRIAEFLSSQFCTSVGWIVCGGSVACSACSAAEEGVFTCVFASACVCLCAFVHFEQRTILQSAIIIIIEIDMPCPVLYCTALYCTVLRNTDNA